MWMGGGRQGVTIVLVHTHVSAHSCYGWVLMEGGGVRGEGGVMVGGVRGGVRGVCCCRVLCGVVGGALCEH